MNKIRHMGTAPTSGSWITAVIRTTHRNIRVFWNGRFWDEGNGERWDSNQLLGWSRDWEGTMPWPEHLHNRLHALTWGFRDFLSTYAHTKDAKRAFGDIHCMGEDDNSFLFNVTYPNGKEVQYKVTVECLGEK